MKKLLGLLMVLSLMTSCGSSKKNEVSVQQNKKIDVPVEQNGVNIAIEQNGKIIQPSNGIITLDKEAFNVIFNLPKSMAVMVNASFDDELLNLASKGTQMTTRSEFSVSYMIAVGLFNPEKVLYVSEEASSPWYYENEEEHNFSKIELENGKYRCTRRIENIADVDSERTVKVEDVEAPIYLVFVPTLNGEEPTGEIKIQASHLKIEWR